MAVLIPQCLSDVNRIETLLSPSSSFPANDKNLFINLINSASRRIISYCRRNFKYVTVSNEDHDGRGVEWLKLNYYPIISITSIYDDVNRSFGAATLLTSGTDYEVYNANAGIVRYLDGTFSNGNSNVRSSYVAGYSEFKVIKGSNDQIAFNDGSARTATLDEGNYNAATLATEIAAEMNEQTSDTITATFSEDSQKFTIASDGSTFELNWNSITNTRKDELGKLIGFDVSTDDTGATSYVANYPSLGVPEDLTFICESIVRFHYSEIRENRTSKFSESIGETSYSFDFSNMSAYVKEMLNSYKILRVSL